jgi:hypothetical protein
MPVCDGCGLRADEAHITSRNERIELAARYRPAQIKVLFLDACPPAKVEDFFYSAGKDRSARSVASRSYFDELVKTLGGESGATTREDNSLVEFRRKRFFVSYGVECPCAGDAELTSALRRLAPTVMKRVQYSLQPEYVVPIGAQTRELIRLFGLIGWGDRLILDKGGPFVDPYFGDPQKQATQGTAFGTRLAKILEALP